MGSNVSLIGVNSQDKIYIGNQGYTNIIADDTNIEGDTQITGSLLMSGSGTISGSLNVTSSFTASGLNYPTVDGIDGSVIVSDGLGNLSMGHGERLVVQVRNNESFTITAGTPLHAVGSIGGSTRVLVVTASADSSNTDTMPAFGIAATDLTPTGDTKDGFAVTTGIFPDYNFTLAPGSITVEEGQVLYVGQNGGLTNVKPDTNDQNLIQNVGIVLKTNGTLVQNFQVSAINRTNDVPNLNQGNIFFGSGSNYAKIHISGALDQTIINNITASGNISSSGIVYGVTGSFSHLQGNSPITVGDPITFQQPITGSNILLTSSITNFDTEVSRSAQAAGFGAGGGISAVVDDTSPQLGGNLDLNSQDITGTGNISINTTSTLTPSIELISTEDSSNASPIIDLKRNSSSPSNGDYLGQIKFKGENDADQEVVYAKITGKISDVTDTTEDGLIEFATKRAGANVINARLTSTDLKLINSTGLEVDGNISASGDISAITGSFDYITGQVSTITWTVDFTDGELNTILYAPYNLAINSITNIYNSPTTAISSSGSPYTLGNAITTGEPIDITVSTGSVINLNITR